MHALKLAGTCAILFGLVLFFSASPSNAVNHQPSILLQPSAPKTSDSQPAQFPGVINYITRTILLDNYGTFSTQDIMAFANYGTSPIQFFYMCLNQTEATELFEMVAQVASGERLHVEAQGFTLNGYSTWKITLPSPVMPGCQSNITVRQYFKNATSVIVDSTGGVNFVLFHSLYTIVPYTISGSKTTVSFPSLTSMENYSPEPLTKTSNTFVYFNGSFSPFQSTMLYMKFQNNDASVVRTISSVLTIEISSNSDWMVSDEVVVENLGRPAISTIMFVVPNKAHAFSAMDSLVYIKGIHDNNLTWGNNFKNITIELGYTRYPIKTNERFAFTFSFLLPPANRLVAGDNKNAISIDIFQICFNPWAMENVKVRIALPQAMRIDLLNVIPDAVDNSNNIQYIIYSQAGATIISSKLVTVVYTYNILEMQERPLLIALIAGIISIFLTSLPFLTFSSPASVCLSSEPYFSLIRSKDPQVRNILWRVVLKTTSPALRSDLGLSSTSQLSGYSMLNPYMEKSSYSRIGRVCNCKCHFINLARAATPASATAVS